MGAKNTTKVPKLRREAASIFGRSGLASRQKRDKDVVVKRNIFCYCSSTVGSAVLLIIMLHGAQPW